MFESGLRFVGQLEGLKREAMLAGAICGKRLPEGWASGRDGVDFFDAKADVEERCWPVPAPSATSASCPVSTRRCTRGETARIERDGRLVGYLGALHPGIGEETRPRADRCSSSVAAGRSGRRPPAEVPRAVALPEVRRDLAALVDQDVPAQDILTQIRAAAGEWLTDLRLTDVYHGKGIDPHRKALPSA
ncbi:hypothetical protein ACPA9J_01260 [Pseudomonas aeruginosa]